MTVDLGPKLNIDASKAGCTQTISYLGRELPCPVISPFSKSEAYGYFVVAIQSEHSNSALLCTSLQRTQPSKALQYLSIIYLFIKQMPRVRALGDSTEKCIQTQCKLFQKKKKKVCNIRVVEGDKWVSFLFVCFLTSRLIQNREFDFGVVAEGL